MSDKPLDLKAFCSTESVTDAQRDQWNRVLGEHLGHVDSTEGWPGAIAELRAHLDRSIWRGEAKMAVAAHQLFTLDLLEATYAEADLESARQMLGIVQDLHPSLQYADLIRSIMRAHHRHYPGQFAENVQHAVLHRLYRTVRDRIRPLAHEARHGSDTYDRWLLALARLAAALWEMHQVPVTKRTEQGGASITLVLGAAGQAVSGKTERPGREICHPLAEWLLEPGEYEEARRTEAYASEQFAHLFTVFRGGYWRRESLKALAAEMRTTAADYGGTLAARQELRLLRAHYKAPAYVVDSLDRELASRGGAQPGDAQRPRGRRSSTHWYRMAIRKLLAASGVALLRRPSRRDRARRPPG